MTAKQEAAREAERLLKTLWTSPDDIPIDPVRIARRLGIDVIDARLDSTVSGALVKEPGQDPIILLNSTDSPNRKRFTCAHEIGHFVKRSDQPDKYEYIDLRDLLSSTGQNPEEVYANEFAACLLMPEKAVKKLHRRGLSEIQLAVRFDVSREAMHYRLNNLGLA